MKKLARAITSSATPASEASRVENDSRMKAILIGSGVALIFALLTVVSISSRIDANGNKEEASENSSTLQIESNDAKIRAFKNEFGVSLDSESAIVYSMGYQIGRRANPGTTLNHLKQIAHQTSTGAPQFRNVMEAGMRDGLEGRTNRLEGVKFD